ncbi:MAG: hypothetical protein A2341_11255 [Deltaproteobacteria bacterium RIFOXYB12_FULL_58_9]|nr:MAG: hypothetical protein A2341_11255 [Deltaproteobacteria bacterium RIFOXYB12_FULL_58_9]
MPAAGASTSGPHQRLKEMLQTVLFDLEHRRELLAEPACGPALLLEPQQIPLCQMHQPAALVATEGHASIGELDENCGIERENGCANLG